MRFSTRRRPAADISLTPLIDILFIVLLFLVLTATFTEQATIRIALPRAATGEPIPDTPSMIRVVVDADGLLYLDGTARTIDEVGVILRAVPDTDRARVTIAADRAASHGSVVQVLDLVRQAGIVRVDIQTFAEPGAAR